jgi:Beta-lactamase enzyme family
MAIAAAPPPPPPAVVQPAQRQAWYGIVRGTAAPGARRVVVKVDGRVVGGRALRGRSFAVDVDLPVGRRTVRVETVDGRGRRSATTVRDVLSLPRAARPRERLPRLDPALQRDVLALTRGFGRTSGVYVASLTTGAGAAWNARASFPAASSLKLAIALAVLSRVDGPPAAGSQIDGLMSRMLTLSDNAAANALETAIGGSTSGGSAIVNALVRSIGLEDTEMYGGYVIGTAFEPPRGLFARGIPLRVEDQPAWGVGKRTTAFDLARLLRATWLASGGIGPFHAAGAGISAAEARYLLWVLAGVRDHGKLDRVIGGAPGIAVLHKAGWIDTARHDSGLVFWRGGVYVATVMTYRSSGAGTSSDVLAGRVAAAALRRLRG